jgi:hypothetical protein
MLLWRNLNTSLNNHFDTCGDLNDVVMLLIRCNLYWHYSSVSIITFRTFAFCLHARIPVPLLCLEALMKIIPRIPSNSASLF